MHWEQDGSKYCSQLSILGFFIQGDSDGVGDESEEADADEGGEEELEDADNTLTETVEGEEKEAGVEVFIDEEHESQFCLETNFMDEEGQEDTEDTAEHKGCKGIKRTEVTGKYTVTLLCNSRFLFTIMTHYIPISSI